MKWPGYAVICHLCVLKCVAVTLSELEDFSNFLRETSQLDQNVKSKLLFYLRNSKIKQKNEIKFQLT